MAAPTEPVTPAASTPEAIGAPHPLGELRFPAPFGKFVLRRRLARGGMADVILATLGGAEGFEKELVVKLVRPELGADDAFVRRFVDEAKTCVRLQHPNIVPIFELGVEAGVLYMAMDLVRGASLAELLREGGALSADEGAYVALEVARALDHAHRRGVIHRDVTPGNVMLDDEGAVKLLDFGIASPVDDDGAAAQREVFGTPGHMAPEQLAGEKLTPAADLFALGALLSEAWSGRAPFRRADARASKTALQTERPPRPSEIASTLAPLDPLLESLLARRPTDRPQQAEQVAKALRAHLRERSIDLDEVARGLRVRVARAMAMRDAAAEGRAAPPPPMPRTMRPTPFGEATKTFATRGDIRAWDTRSGRASEGGDDSPSTRRLEGEGDGATRRLDEAAPTSTRRIEPAARGSAPLDVVGDASTMGGRQKPRRWALVLAIPFFVASALAIRSFTHARTSAGAPAPSVVSTASTDPGLAEPRASAPSSGASSLAGARPSTSVSAAIPSVLPSAAASPVSANASARAAGSSTLAVRSTPPALVAVDGRPVGTTPVNLGVAAGSHRLTLRPQGLAETFDRTFEATAGQTVVVRGDFNDEPRVSIERR
jgi:serine/threonine protein kinase